MISSGTNNLTAAISTENCKKKWKQLMRPKPFCELSPGTLIAKCLKAKQANSTYFNFVKKNYTVNMKVRKCQCSIIAKEKTLYKRPNDTELSTIGRPSIISKTDTGIVSYKKNPK